MFAFGFDLILHTAIPVASKDLNTVAYMLWTVMRESAYQKPVCAVTWWYSLLNPLDHARWSLFFNHQLTPVSRSQTSMPHLTRGTSFLLHFAFLISSIRHHIALLHIFTAFSTLILKLSSSQSLSLHSRLSLPKADLLELWPLVVWQSLAAVVLVSAAD